MNTLDRLNQISPARCRAVARFNGRPMTHEHLASVCGWSKGKIIAISRLTRWDTITIADAEKYANACGLKLHRLRSSFYYKSKRMRAMLKRLNMNQRRMYRRLLSN